jgi:hypothetical protein|tara:strand:- start:179 stop:439 length:261 start_codon:yes stop_codon:yes gene_type:complete
MINIATAKFMLWIFTASLGWFPGPVLPDVIACGNLSYHWNYNLKPYGENGEVVDYLCLPYGQTPYGVYEEIDEGQKKWWPGKRQEI